MWTVIYIAPAEQIAKRISQKLMEQGFLVKVRMSRATKQYEILVPQSELIEVTEVLHSVIG